MSADRETELQEILREKGLLGSRTKERLQGVGLQVGGLSSFQRSIWFYEQLEPETRIFNRPTLLRMDGKIDKALFWMSINRVTKRQQALRTIFPVVKGEPSQKVAPWQPSFLETIALNPKPGQTDEACVLEKIGAFVNIPFDLENGPLVRWVLFQVQPGLHYFLAITHHLIFDGWSEGVLLEEICSHYRSLSGEDRADLQELEIQFLDFIHWFETTRLEKNRERLLEYWRNELLGAPLALDLPKILVSDLPEPPEALEIVFSRQMTARLGNFSAAHQVTLFMTLLTAFQVLLSRYTQKKDLIVGSPVAGRYLPEAENVIGCFINMLPIRAEIQLEETFQTLLVRQRDRILSAFSFSEQPFDELVVDLGPTRTLTHNPIFQTFFQFRKFPDINLDLPGVRASRVPVNLEFSGYDLVVEVTDREGQLHCRFATHARQISDGQLRSLAGYYQSLLERILEDPSKRVGELDYLPDTERVTLLTEWSRIRGSRSVNSCLHELFEAQVGRTPDALALVFEGKRMSYADLDRRANQLAHRLQRQGVIPGTTVGIYMERSLEIYISVLGIMKAGGAYLPLDPAYPTKRIGFIVRDASPILILTQDQLKGQLPEDVPRVYVDRPGEHLAGELETKPPSEVTAANLAYIIYTSGSTGDPKGVMIPHRGAVNRILWGQDAYPMHPTDRSLQFSSINFDASVIEIFLLLSFGGALVQVPGPKVSDIDYLIEVMKNEDVSVVWNFTPSFLRVLLNHKRSGELNLRLLCSGGEALTPDLMNQVLTVMPNTTLLNAYGPTETSVSMLFWVAKSGDRVSLGRTISNVQVYILDPELQPVAPGVPGELFIGGIGVGWGYLQRPGLTADNFIPDPYGGSPGSRLYKTGDRVRWLPDGEIEFLGRFDDQVKLRGYRVELGEIAANLQRHPDIAEAVVTAVEHPSTGVQLISYVVPVSDHQPSADELRWFLGARLPDYMVPSGTVFLDRFPVNQSGKIDYSRLPEPQSRDLTRRPGVPPTTGTERVLFDIWSSVLGQKDFGVSDDFFDLGGHSLIATQIVSRLRSEFQLPLPLTLIFQSPNIRDLARVIDEMDQDQGPSRIIPSTSREQR